MKKITIGVFSSRSSAESAISSIKQDLAIGTSDISYLYRNADETVHTNTVDGVVQEDTSAVDGAVTGAVTGGTIGAIAGIATVAGLIPIIGPIFVAGPLIAALGFGAGAVATTAAATATGAAAGGLIGALSTLGVSDTVAREYEERISAGDTLVSVHSEKPEEVAEIMTEHGATSVGSYTS